jgi:hypothetical protein
MSDSDAASTPGAFPGDASGPARRRQEPGPWPGGGPAALSDEDVLALLAGLGVAGTHDPEDKQDAIAADEWAVRQAYDSGPGGDDGPGRPVSPVLAGEHLPAGPGLAAMLALDPPAGASDWDLPGLAAGYRRIAAWAQARELAAAAEIAARCAAANPKIGTTGEGRPVSLPPEAAAEVALELRMSQPGASAWTVLGCRLRWDLPGTGAALAAGQIDLPRARIIAEATTWLTPEHAAAVERRVLPGAGGQTTGQLRAAARRAVLAVDPDGAEQRRRDTERSAKLALYPGEEGTATLTGSGLPGLQAAAAMARITAMARALKSSGAHGGLDLLRASIFLGLLLGTLPYIPPPAGAPPDNPPPGNPPDPGPDGGPGHGSATGSPDGDAPDGEPGYGGSSAGPDGEPGYGGAPDGSAAGGTDGAPAGPQPSSLASDRTGGGTTAGPASDGPDSSSSSAADAASGGGSPEPDGDSACLPGWWPDIPPPGDADAPAGDTGPPDPLPAPGSHLDDGDDDWPQLPSPDWPPLPAGLPAPPGPGPAEDATQSQASALARTGLLDVLIPWATLTGQSQEPAILGRIGPISPGQARQLLALAVRSPATTWRVIITSDTGRALAVHHARPPRPARTRDTGPNMTGVIGRVTITIRAATIGTPDAWPGPDSPLTIQHIAPAILHAARHAANSHAEQDDGEGGGCAHPMASAAYRPPPRIREHVAARDRTCRFGPCGQPAWRTDLDHTLPWHKGGPTCPCNLGGCCRTHHKIKQLPGWHLDQPHPGTFTWTTPAGRTYHVEPDHYPV